MRKNQKISCHVLLVGEHNFFTIAFYDILQFDAVYDMMSQVMVIYVLAAYGAIKFFLLCESYIIHMFEQDIV